MKHNQFTHRFWILIILFISCAACTNEDQQQTTYSNPVIPGDFPDPSIIRVGGSYYAAGTSFDFAPNYPIYMSSDLVNWDRIGSVFAEPPAWADDDFWAPELFYEKGTFYVYYTCKRKETRVACIGVATTNDIHKGFTDKGIIVEWGEEAIDAFVFKDDDGKKYITWKAYGLTEGRPIEILASELSVDGLSLVGEHFTLTDHTKGWKGAGDEGQCLVKHNNTYYLFYSVGGCCDNRCDYRVMVARSKNLRSGWEQYSGNPILQGGDDWLCTGHGTLVSTEDNQYFYLYHAYNINDFEYIGRQGMLDEVTWDEETGWPSFKNGNTPSKKAKTPYEKSVQKRDTILRNLFSSNFQLSMREWDLNYPKPGLKIENNSLHVIPSHSGINFLGFGPERGGYTFEAKVKPGISHSGIGIYTHQQKMFAITASLGELTVFKMDEGKKEVLAGHALGDINEIFIKFNVRYGKYIRCFWSAEGAEWQELILGGSEEYDASFLATWGYSPRTGLIMDGDPGQNYNYSKIKLEYLFP